MVLYYGNVRQRKTLAMDPETPVELLRLLATDAREDVRRIVAENPRTLESTLRALAADTDDHVRAGVARNPSTNANTLHLLARNGVSFVRGAVASNPRTPPQILLKFATQTSDMLVQWFARRNPSLPNLNTSRRNALQNRSRNVIQAVLSKHGVNLSLPRSNLKYRVRNIAHSPPTQPPNSRPKSKRSSAPPTVARSIRTIKKHHNIASQAGRKLMKKKLEENVQYYHNHLHHLPTSIRNLAINTARKRLKEHSA